MGASPETYEAVAGRLCFLLGRPVTDNPYPAGSNSHILFDLGYREAAAKTQQVQP